MQLIENVDWEVVGQVSTAFAAFFALLTAWQARSLWRLDRKMSAFELVVLKPIAEAGEDFVRQAEAVIASGIEDVAGQSTPDAIGVAINRLTESFNETFYRYKYRVHRAVISWPYEDLRTVEDAVATSIQDQITPHFPALPHKAPPFAEYLNRGVADVQARALGLSPALKAGRLKRGLHAASRRLQSLTSDDKRPGSQ